MGSGTKNCKQAANFVVDLARLSDGLQDLVTQNRSIPLTESMSGNLCRACGHAQLASSLGQTATIAVGSGVTAHDDLAEVQSSGPECATPLCAPDEYAAQAVWNRTRDLVQKLDGDLLQHDHHVDRTGPCIKGFTFRQVALEHNGNQRISKCTQQLVAEFFQYFVHDERKPCGGLPGLFRC